MEQLRELSPHLHDVLCQSASNGRKLLVKPVSRTRLEDEMSALPPEHVQRLTDFLVMNIQEMHSQLKMLEREMRRYPTMKYGHYG